MNDQLKQCEVETSDGEIFIFPKQETNKATYEYMREIMRINYPDETVVRKNFYYPECEA